MFDLWNQNHLVLRLNCSFGSNMINQHLPMQTRTRYLLWEALLIHCLFRVVRIKKKNEHLVRYIHHCNQATVSHAPQAPARLKCNSSLDINAWFTHARRMMLLCKERSTVIIYMLKPLHCWEHKYGALLWEPSLCAGTTYRRASLIAGRVTAYIAAIRSVVESIPPTIAQQRSCKSKKFLSCFCILHYMRRRQVVPAIPVVRLLSFSSLLCESHICGWMNSESLELPS